MKVNEFKYKIYRFLDIIFAIILIATVGLFWYFNHDIDFKYRSKIQLSIPYIFLSLWGLCSILIYAKMYLYLNTTKFRKFIDVVLLKSYRFKDFSIYVSAFYTALITGISLWISFEFLEKAKLNDFISSSNLFMAVAALYVTIYSIIFAIIASKSQKQEIYGFESFLNNVADDLYILSEKAHLPNNDKVYEVVIVDFHPFIGSKSLGIENSVFKRYIKAIEKTALNDKIKLTIVCHSKQMINNSFNAEEKIHSESLINNLAVNDAIDILATKGQKVNIWRSDIIGPYHFIIIDDIAYDYLVVPFHYLSNKNIIQGNKHIDQSKVAHIHKAYHDIISATIKPTEISLNSNKVKKDNFYNTTDEEGNKLEDKFKNIKGIKLRFQFEEKEDRNRNPIINGKKGNFPIYELKEKEIDYAFYILDEYFEIEKVDNISLGFKEVYVTHNITEHISKYAELLSFAIDSLNAESTETIEKEHKGMTFKIHFDSTTNIYKLKEMIFKFNNNDIYLEHRTFSKSIADKVFYKIKIIKDNELIESEYSYKSKVTLW